jgi:hypothetical protein
MSGQTMLGMVIKFLIFTHLGACVFLKYGYQSFGLFECVVTKREREKERTYNFNSIQQTTPLHRDTQVQAFNR